MQLMPIQMRCGRARSWLPVQLMVVLALVLIGCDTPEPPTLRAPSERARPAAEPTEAQAPPAISDIERHRFARTARDPFAMPLIEAAVGGDRTFEADCDAESDPLGFTEASRIRLLGLITGTATPRALVLAGSPQAIIATEGMRVGPRCSQRIIEIRDNEVVIGPFGADDDERRRTILVLSQQQVEAQIDEDN